MAEVIGDRALDDVIEVAASETVDSAQARLSEVRWVVVVDDEGAPVCVAAAEDVARLDPERRLRDVATAFPPFVVVEEATPVKAAVRSGAFRTMDAQSPVLVRRGHTLAGVWAGEDLAEAILANVQLERLAWDATLPGSVSIPKIVRLCGFADGAGSCLDRRIFPEKPDAMPPCRNPNGLSAHAFVW